MGWAVMCDFCEAPAALPDAGGLYAREGPGPLPGGWLWLALGHDEGWNSPNTRRGLVCGGACAVRLVARWQDELAEVCRKEALVEARRRGAEAADRMDGQEPWQDELTPSESEEAP